MIDYYYIKCIILYIYCAYPKYMAIGLNLFLGSQSICFVGFCVSYCGWFYARHTQIHSYLPKPIFLPHKITHLLSLSVLLFFLVFFPKLPTPFSSFSPPIYRRGWVEELWLLLILSANGGPIPLSQSGRFVGKVGMALELIPTSDVCSVVTLLNAWPGSWVRCASNDWGGGGLLKVFTVVLFRVPGPKLCSEESGPRLKVQVQGRLYDVLWSLGLRNTGSRAQALYRGPNSRTSIHIYNISN